MLLGGLQKLTTLDFSGVISALVFTQGCNFHCPYCHNAQLIPARPLPGADPAPDADAVLAFLHKRRTVLDGVAITGGEPCLQPDLEAFCGEIRKIGYKIKLDTNGSFPEVVRNLLEKSLVDYVAVDVKTAPDRYAPNLTRDENAGASLVETLAILEEHGVPHEARTTCVAPFVEESAVAAMANIVPRAVPWFFQRATIATPTPHMRPVPHEEIQSLIAAIAATHPLAALR